MSVQEDSCTSPDGVIIHRKRIGDATVCRRSGSINPLGMRGMLFANEAGDAPRACNGRRTEKDSGR